MKIIYCDGSSLGNPGKGGWGVVAIDNKKKKYWEFGEGVKLATNNQMELAACIFALKLILESNKKEEQENTKFELRLDSKYVIQGSTVWIKSWVKNNWKNSQKKEVLNKEMWQEIQKLLTETGERKIQITWTHIYGHTGEKWNERCDEIAKARASGDKIVLAKAAEIS